MLQEAVATERGLRRIAILSHTSALTGVPECTARLLERLDRARFEPAVFCPYPGPFTERAEALDVRVECGLTAGERDRVQQLPKWQRGLRSGTSYLRSLHRFLDEFDPDLVYLPSIGLAMPAWMSRHCRRPMVVHCNESWSYLQNRVSRLRRRPLLRGDHPVIAASDSTRQMLLSVGVEPARIRLVHNGVDTDRFRFDSTAREEIRRAWGIPRDVVVIGAIGALQPRKGTLDFVRMAARLRHLPTALHFVLIGEAVDPDYGAAVRREIDRLGLEEHFTLAGFRSDVPACLSALDIVAAPTREEAFALVNLEAMATERPVVSYGVHGTAEALVDGEAGGYVVDAGDLDGLVGSVSGLVADPELRARLGRAGRERVIEHFGIERFARGVQDTFEVALAARAHRSEERQ